MRNLIVAIINNCSELAKTCLKNTIFKAGLWNSSWRLVHAGRHLARHNGIFNFLCSGLGRAQNHKAEIKTTVSFVSKCTRLFGRFTGILWPPVSRLSFWVCHMAYWINSGYNIWFAACKVCRNMPVSPYRLHCAISCYTVAFGCGSLWKWTLVECNVSQIQRSW